MRLPEWFKWRLFFAGMLISLSQDSLLHSLLLVAGIALIVQYWGEK